MAGLRKIRRTDREILDFNEILDVLRRAQTIRLGLNGDPYPYVVPLSYGYEAFGEGDGAARGVAIYIHGATEGFKHELIKRDNHVCVEADILHRFAERGEGDDKSLTTEYESVIGFGTAEAISGAEAIKGMELLIEHCGFKGFTYDLALLEKVKAYKLILTTVTGKRNLI